MQRQCQRCLPRDESQFRHSRRKWQSNGRLSKLSGTSARSSWHRGCIGVKARKGCKLTQVCESSLDGDGIYRECRHPALADNIDARLLGSHLAACSTPRKRGRPNVMTMMKVVRCDSGGNAMGCTQIGIWIQLFIVKACQTRLFMLSFSIFWSFFLVKHSHLWLHERKQHLCHLMLVKPPFSLANPNIACGSSIPIHG